MSFGQPFTTSYAPKISCPPTCPGMATVPAPGLAAPRTLDVLLATKKPRTQPTPIASTVNATLRISRPPAPKRRANKVAPHTPVDDITIPRVSEQARTPRAPMPTGKAALQSNKQPAWAVRFVDGDH